VFSAKEEGQEVNNSNHKYNFMKFIIFILLSKLVFPEEIVGKNEVKLESTFKEGFGVFIKKEVLISKVKPSSSALYQINTYKILTEKNTSIPIIFYNTDTFKKIEKSFTNDEQKRCEIIAYEVIESSGIPSLNKDVAGNELQLTKDTGINISPKMVVVDFKVISE
jgi:hypothetical protein